MTRKTARRDPNVDRHITPRKPITIQLSEKDDADLIEALAALPHRQRQATIKAILRRYFQTATPGVSPELDSALGMIGEWLNDLQGGVNGQFSALRSDMTSAVFAAPNGSTPIAPTFAPVEAVPQVDKAELEARARNLKKSQW